MTLRQILRLLSFCCQAKGKKVPAKRKPGASRPLWNVWSHTACQIIPSIPMHTPKLRNIHTIHLHTCKNTTSSSANPRAEALRKNVYFPHPLSSPLPRFALSQNGTLFLFLLPIFFALIAGGLVIGEASEGGICGNRFPQGEEPAALAQVGQSTQVHHNLGALLALLLQSQNLQQIQTGLNRLHTC